MRNISDDSGALTTSLEHVGFHVMNDVESHAYVKATAVDETHVHAGLINPMVLLTDRNCESGAWSINWEVVGGTDWGRT